MKQFLLVFTFVALGLTAYSQDLSILLVDDSYDNFNNVDSIGNSITASGYTFELFDAQGMGVSPTFAEMADYDLVIWHTSNSGPGLYLWNGTDEANGELAQYLADGGNLWLIGHDFLYDLYDVAPDTFATGDFVYDYLGISSYDAQSNVDDGGLGLPLVTPADGQPIAGLGDIDWIFATLYFADVITGVEGTTTIYEMGDDDYVFAGATAGLWYDNGISKVLTFAFDLALASSATIRDNTVQSVLDYYASVLVNTQTVTKNGASLQVFPNPVKDVATLSLELTQSATVQMDIINMQGQKINSFLAPTQLAAGEYSFNWHPANGLPNGLYQLRIQVDGEVVSQPLLLAR